MSALEVPEGFYLRPIAEQDVPQVLEVGTFPRFNTRKLTLNN